MDYDTDTIGVKIAKLNVKVAAMADKLEAHSFGLSAIAAQLAIDVGGEYELDECGENKTAYVPNRNRYHATVASTATDEGRKITIRVFPGVFFDWQHAAAYATYASIAAKIAMQWEREL